MVNHPLLQEYLTASGSNPERSSHKELTPELINNANTLLFKLQELFEGLGIDLSKYKFSSGFRPTDVNSKIPNAAKKSLHSKCLAADIIDDKEQNLAKLMQSDNAKKLRKKLGIWLESPAATKGKFTNWCHLDISLVRIKRDSMEFMP